MRVLRAIAPLGWLAVFACSGAPEGEPVRFKPPPMPGTSITHSRECGCRRCEPASCCGGDPERSDVAPSDKACGELDGGYDFSRSEECGGIAIASCAGRCARVTWRAAAGKSCDDRRPADCCAED